MRAASHGLLFETTPVNLKDKCVDGTKTLTTRVWCRANFEALSTAAKSTLIPARTNYSVSSRRRRTPAYAVCAATLASSRSVTAATCKCTTFLAP